MEFFKRKPNPLLLKIEALENRVHVLEVQLTTYTLAEVHKDALVEEPPLVEPVYPYEINPLTGMTFAEKKTENTPPRPQYVTDKMLQDLGFKHLINLRSVYSRLVSTADSGEIYSYKEKQYVKVKYTEDAFSAFVQNTADYHKELRSVYASHMPVVPTLKPCDTFLLLFLLNAVVGELENKRQYVQNAYELLSNYFAEPSRTPVCGGWIVFFIVHCAYYRIDVAKAIPVLLNQTSKKPIENFAVKISNRLKNSEQTAFEGF